MIYDRFLWVGGAYSMAIDVEWQDERGESLARYAGPPLDLRLCEASPADSVCLRFIDPYGSATFNQGQIEVLMDELLGLDRRGVDPELARQIDALVTFLAQARGQTHTYVKFIGD